ncbi:Zinc finger, RING-type [Corchorus olitorius]|uniref:Zinc finger, RING-type n=1 Tax=Corchorus olitorius TaxID=93759 RepID=A0A1R3JSI0_9ROSI|nr:Zinc finger, RING-type [Corchorus olitorius]
MLRKFFSFGRRTQVGASTSEINDEHRSRSASSLVPVPVFFTVESVKNQLPVMQYGSFVKRKSGDFVAADDDDPTCIVCMKGVEPSDEVRELGNCNHVFHRDCLDAWIDLGNVTCPLCKSKLSSASPQGNNNLRLAGNDPWRRERMIYLFGEDIDFDDLMIHF